eukprot:CAMPEP_0184523194 /NCGR_PEP_ID=MMETSP0198_2-20121128/8738_1 /TAXON_ID=1112570 /ORGANISM="Thraustochytrium sp., Strain LLF1b" /LENGTH=378 /DNA_ID=CAMNT_0026914177 /DNA_START=616 /DNA_END=1752 /DNA_ORIENTATION=+
MSGMSELRDTPKSSGTNTSLAPKEENGSTQASGGSQAVAASSGNAASDFANTTEGETVSYRAEMVIGNGSFGVVFKATVVQTGEVVAIKKVLQDRRFKNRELQIMRELDHPNIVQLKHCFYANGEDKDELYLNLVLEFVPETVYRIIRNHRRDKEPIPMLYTKLYVYQLSRALAYIHDLGICHRDIKPQNLLLDPTHHTLKLCDFGSAKILVEGQPNVSYICSRFYRAPELIFGSTKYTCAIDVWSMGCVCGELMLGLPMFPGGTGVDQLVEIIRLLGTPEQHEREAMNRYYVDFRFPQIKAQPWKQLFSPGTEEEGIDLVSKMLLYQPKSRITPLEALKHPFFDQLRDKDTRLPNGNTLPPDLFQYTAAEERLFANT